jgi:hypothetical protein
MRGNVAETHLQKSLNRPVKPLHPENYPSQPFAIHSFSAKHSQTSLAR